MQSEQTGGRANSPGRGWAGERWRGKNENYDDLEGGLALEEARMRFVLEWRQIFLSILEINAIVSFFI